MWVVVGLEGVQRDLRDVGVVTDEAREGHFLERVPLLLSEDPGVLPPEPAETQAGSPRSPASGPFHSAKGEGRRSLETCQGLASVLQDAHPNVHLQEVPPSHPPC